MLTLGRDMLQIAGKSNFVISARIAGLIAIVCAMAYGAYVAAHGSVATGLVWIMSAITLGWVCNMVFSLLLVLVCDARHSVARHKAGSTKTNMRFREQHARSGGRMFGTSNCRELVVSGSRKPS